MDEDEKIVKSFIKELIKEVSESINENTSTKIDSDKSKVQGKKENTNTNSKSNNKLRAQKPKVNKVPKKNILSPNKRNVANNKKEFNTMKIKPITHKNRIHS